MDAEQSYFLFTRRIDSYCSRNLLLHRLQVHIVLLRKIGNCIKNVQGFLARYFIFYNMEGLLYVAVRIINFSLLCDLFKHFGLENKSNCYHRLRET